MQLDENLKSKVRFHLGFNAGAQIPAGDRARLEEAMALVPDELWYNEIVYHVQRCDNAWKISAYVPDDILEPNGTGAFQFSRQEEISGDVSRTINTSDPLKADEYIREIYLREVDRVSRNHSTYQTIVALKYVAMRLSVPAQNLLWQCLALQIQQ